jgi:hypothetical protein
MKHSFIRRIEELSSWKDNWDGHGSLKPKMKSIANARSWAMKINALILKLEPTFISADAEGNVVLEWWRKNKYLSLDVSEKYAYFLQSIDGSKIKKIRYGIKGNLTNKNLLSVFKWLTI